MKKVMMIIISTIIIFTVTGCGTKTPINVDEFVKKMEEKEYIVQDLTEEANQTVNTEYTYVAANRNDNYQIEFFEFETEEEAIKFYDDNIKLIKEDSSIAGIETINKGNNYQSYALTVHSKYKIISRIDRTVLYSGSSESNKTKINNDFKSLGY